MMISDIRTLSSFEPQVFPYPHPNKTFTEFCVTGKVSGVMAVGHNLICSSIVFYLFLFCCLSRSSLYLYTFVFCSSNGLDNSGLTKITDEGDLYRASCLSPMHRTHHLGFSSSTRSHRYFIACVIEKWSSVSESNFQQIWSKVQCKKFKSFLLCTVYRPPDAPIDFLENLSEKFVDSLLHGSNVIIIGDLNCNRMGGDPEGHALSDFCSTFGLSQLVIDQYSYRLGL